MEELRLRSRQVHQDSREKLRSFIINSKRQYLSESSFVDEQRRIDENEVKTIALALTVKQSKDEEVLEKLKRLKLAFVQGDNLHKTFIKTGGALYGLVGTLSCCNIEIQIEATSCTINLLAVADEKTTLKVAKFTVPYLILYLQHSCANLQELSAWALGNVAAGNKKCCQLLKTHLFVENILTLLEESKSADVVYSALFALKCYMKNVQNDWNEILSLGLANKLPRFIKSPESDNILLQAVIIIFYLSTIPENDLYLMDSGCAKHILINLNNTISKYQKEGNVFLNKFGCELITVLIRSAAGLAENYQNAVKILLLTDVSAISSLLTCNYLHIHKETLWLLSNLASHATVTVDACPWHDVRLLKRVADRLLGPDEVVEYALTFFFNVLEVHRWACSLPLISEVIIEDTLSRLMLSSNPTTVELTVKLLKVINKMDSTIYNYSDQLIMRAVDA